jgi:hypothetical protein
VKKAARRFTMVSVLTVFLRPESDVNFSPWIHNIRTKTPT